MLSLLLTACATLFAPTDLLLWYSGPAKRWEGEALPIGNGRMGGMVFGGVAEERIQFNVDSLWTGDENPGGEYRAPGMGAYQNFGELRVRLGEVDPSSKGASVSAYRRSLDLATGIHRVEYIQGGVLFVREAFCSRPHEVLVVRFAASRSGCFTGAVSLHDAHAAETRAGGTRLVIAGALENGLAYEAQLHVQVAGGRRAIAGDELRLEECDAFTLYLVADTDYAMDAARGWRGDHPHEHLSERARQALGMRYDDLRAAHVSDHAALFDRVSLDLGTSPPTQLALPTDRRLAAVKEGAADPDLEEILFQYGRYLLMGSSRPGSLPANLQGLWNHSNSPPWCSDYHSNINLQMNYWLAEPANLAECHTPLFDLFLASLPAFRTGTRASFGDVPGFTVRTSHNIYGGMGWKWNLPASAWYCQHLWEHYAFGRDRGFLERVAYPVLKEVCAFWQNRLVEIEDEQQGRRLVVPGGWSPEHGPEEDGCSYDQQIVWELFTNYLEAADLLERDPGFRDAIAGLRERLLGPKVGRWGQLQEWRTDRDDPKDRHRHTSHLFAVYPGRQISRATTPRLAEAARLSLAARGETGDSRRSWTWPWRCALWARLGEPENGRRMITSLLKYNTLPNLIATHPPLQLDGSFGITAAMCEMLVQSHADEIHLLPALPAAYPDGHVRGLRARGGFTVDITWEDGALTEAVITASVDSSCNLRHGDKTLPLTLAAGASHRVR